MFKDETTMIMLSLRREEGGCWSSVLRILSIHGGESFFARKK